MSFLCFLFQQTGYYDPSNQYATTSLAAAAGGRNQSQHDGTVGGSVGLNSLSSSSGVVSSSTSGGVNTTMTGSGASGTNIGSSAGGSGGSSMGGGQVSDKTSAFAMNAVTNSTSSPIPANANSQNQNTTNLANLNQFAATNAFAAQAQALPPGYAYFYGQVPNLQAAYGATAAGVYPATPMAVPTAAGGTTATTQFQKNAYGTR